MSGGRCLAAVLKVLIFMLLPCLGV
jgi:hypothetical protein